MTVKPRDSWTDVFGDVKKRTFHCQGSLLMDILAVSPVSPCCLHPIPTSSSFFLLPFYCRCGLQRWQGQVRTDRKRDEEGEKGKTEKEDWRDPGGQFERLYFCFSILICIDKMVFFLHLSFTLFLSCFPSIYSDCIILFQIIFCFFPLPLLSPFLWMSQTSTSSLCL